MRIAQRIPYIAKHSKHGKVVNRDHSLGGMVGIELSQSQCIRLGHAMECVVNELVRGNNWRCIKDVALKTTTRKIQKDVCFIDDGRKSIVYAEVKANIQLDSEKRRKTMDKIEELHQAFLESYGAYDVACYLVAGRYLEDTDIPEPLRKWYGARLVSFNGFMRIMGAPVICRTEEAYANEWRIIAEHMFSPLKD